MKYRLFRYEEPRRTTLNILMHGDTKDSVLKHLFSILFIFSYCGFPGQKKIVRYRNGAVRAIIYHTDSRKPGNCFIKIFYPNGQIYKICTMHNWEYVGETALYFPNGKIREIDSLSVPCNIASNIMCDGVSIRYHENGTLSRRYTIKDGVCNGPIQFYDSSGNLLLDFVLKDDKIKNGEYKQFYPNGNPLFKGTFKNDTLVGFQYYFDEYGDSMKYYNTSNGHIDFPYKKWLSLELMLYGVYTDERKNSVTWLWYDYTGKVIKRKIAYPVKGVFACPE